jgi:hypothetical protein
LLITLAAALVTAFWASLASAPFQCTQTESNQAFAITGKSGCSGPYDYGLTGSRETGHLEEWGIALEEDNSQAMSRVDPGQPIFGMDRRAIEPKARPDAGWSVRPDISPPLLV